MKEFILTLDTVKAGLMCSILLLGLLVGVKASAGCEVWEIIDMVDDAEGRADIREACDDQMIDAGSCSVSKVYRLYENKGMDVEGIIAECTKQQSSSYGDSHQAALWSVDFKRVVASS